MAKPINKRVVALGELLLRLTTKATSDSSRPGSSMPVIRVPRRTSRSRWPISDSKPTRVSTVPDHEIGQACINYLRQYGVNTDHIVRGGDR